MKQFTGILGILAILGACWAFSTNRNAVKWKIVAWGISLQLLFALVVLKFQWGQNIMETAGAAVNRLLSYAQVGASFVFGTLADPGGPSGLVFAFYVLPTIIFMAAFFAVLYHFGIMQVIIKGAAWLMTRLMGVSGAESLDVAASIFMGQTEAPLTIRPFLPDLTRSELMTVMTAGMAHVSGGIMAAYISKGVEAKHLLGAVIMTAPGTLLIAKTLVPETEVPASGTRVEMAHVDEAKGGNLLGAISRGTGDGLNLAINVAAMLIAFLALIALTNGIMGWVHGYVGWFPKSLESVLGWLFAPVAWLIGIPWKDASQIGSLLGIRMVGNELIAYGQLGAIKPQLDPRSFTIATYALCGFANLSSIGIQIGGIGALAPGRRGDLAKLGFRAMLAGTMANLVSAAIVGIMT
ncbi:MAG TPA: nucleoside transporter C-terminal domain-containing protein [Candidatus Baltobacteraceae bacterium]|jgi:CNT family concentrative nucleoside transporter|nr:nucleoside transporter C-terminal domain-containing protein [Candidatus Baltobacteraceae bacterium]